MKTSARLSDGYFFALTKEQLKSLRALKGDRARREGVVRLRSAPDAAMVNTSDNWHFIQFVLARDPAHRKWARDYGLVQGQHLHRGELSWIELVDPASYATIAQKLSDLKKADFQQNMRALDKKKFLDTSVPFWVDWKTPQRLEQEIRQRLNPSWEAVRALAVLYALAVEEERAVVFHTSF